MPAAGYKMLRASGLTVSRRAFAGAGSSRALLKAQRCRSAGEFSAAVATYVHAKQLMQHASNAAPARICARTHI